MIDDREAGAAALAVGAAETAIMELVVGPLGPEYAGESWTVQRAAYVSEAQRYRVTTIPPLRESLAELHADLVAAAGDGPGDLPRGATVHLGGLAVLARGAWLGPRLVGSVRGRVDATGTTMEVARFAVAPDVQRRGIGRRLLAAVHAAVPPSVRSCSLVVAARSDGNLRLYAAAGYRPVGRLVDADGIELVRMERLARPVDDGTRPR